MEINVWTYAFEPPGPSFSESDDTKYNWNEISIAPVNLTNYPNQHEVLGAIVYFTGPFNNTSNINVNYKIYNHNTGFKMFEMTQSVPPPPPEQQWNWYKLKFWTGRASWEIYGPCTIRIEITISGWASGSTTLYMNVISPIRETVTWQSNVPDHGTKVHSFYLLSLYGVNTNDTLGGFQISNLEYVKRTIVSESRYDYITTQNVSKNDCLTIIAENYDGLNITGIYDYWIQNSVI